MKKKKEIAKLVQERLEEQEDKEMEGLRNLKDKAVWIKQSR
mgnify:CR=1 FL=1